MANEQQSLPKRDQIPEELTWKLEDIFATDEEWEQERKEIERLIPQFQEYQGKLNNSADQLYSLLQLQDQVSDRLSRLYTYAHMRYDQDTTFTEDIK